MKTRLLTHMRTRLLTRAGILVSVSALNLTFSPAAWSQTPSNPTGSSEDTKTTDSTADQNSSMTGSSTNQPGTLERTNSKDTGNSLDKNPSTAPTDSEDKTATKNPNDTTLEATTEDRNAPSKAKEASAAPDKTFLIKAAQGGITEVQLGQLAQEKGASADVKQFGSRMVQDHSKSNDELKVLAQQKGVTVPSKLDARHQATVDRFKHLSGAAFDRAYVRAMVKDHKSDAAEFTRESTSAKDPDVKTFAGKTLGMIKGHLAEVQSIETKLK